MPAPAQADQAWRPLVRRLVADGFDKPALDALFFRPELRFDPLVMARKMNVLLALRLSPRPAVEEPGIYLSYLNPFLILRARSFFEAQRTALLASRERFGVSEDVLVALLVVESKLGRSVGSRPALITLASMALAGDFSLIAPYIDRRPIPARTALWLRWQTAQKASWAYGELKALLIYARRTGRDPAGIPGSAYGAIGLCQFMPTNAVRYGLDLSGDGRADLFDPADALFSAAHFLAANGWRPDLDRRGQLRVLFRYNHSRPYTRTILAVADRLSDLEDPL